MNIRTPIYSLLGGIVFGLLACVPASAEGFLPGHRVLLDAHNCYPYQGRWADRIDRALATGLPVAIEQDLVWHEDPDTGEFRSIVSHGSPFTGQEPSLDDYFFERIRPIVEKALERGNDGTWPLITLNIDFKNYSLEHTETTDATLKKYAAWLTSAPKTNDPAKVTPLDVKPVLVLVGGDLNQEEIFANRVPEGGRILAFGQASPPKLNDEGLSRRERDERNATLSPTLYLPKPATNYRRWWNKPWSIVETGGQRRAGDWDERDEARLRALVDHAHALGYWVRLYTLNGHEGRSTTGWSAGYNFGSLEAAQLRWEAVLQTGVDFVATDMYQEFSQTQKRHNNR